jgi:hypothetical protein
VFLHPVGSASDIVHSVASGPQNINAPFFMLRWAQCSFHKNHTGTRHFEHVFLHPIGSGFHVVNSGVSRPQNIDTLFLCSTLGTDSTKSVLEHITPKMCFCCWWDLRVTECIPMLPGHETSTHYFSFSDGPSAVSIKSAPEHVTLNFYFCIRWDLRVT